MRPFVLLLLVVGLPAGASAHLDLLDPPSRYPTRELKDGPCGIRGGASGTITAVYAPGDVVTIAFEETVDHPSHYRIAFSADGDGVFRDPVCQEHCETGGADPVFAPSEGGAILADFIDDSPAPLRTVDVTLPDVECETCVIQAIQVMYDKRPYTSPGNDIYYRCADVALRAPGGTRDLGPPVPRPDLGPLPDLGTADGGPATGGGDDADGGGCSAGGSSPMAPLGLLAMALVGSRRRRSAP